MADPIAGPSKAGQQSLLKEHTKNSIGHTKTSSTGPPGVTAHSVRPTTVLTAGHGANAQFFTRAALSGVPRTT
jgi:hypothetical protein